MFERVLYRQLKEKVQPGKVLVLYGPRRSGKTVLLERYAEDARKDGVRVKMLHGESRAVQDRLSSRIPEQLRSYIGDTDVLIIDEAQKIANIGEHLKLIVDTIPALRVIASGSASFDLAQKVGEPLTGRKRTVTLYPMSAQEVVMAQGSDAYFATLDQRLIFGMYPEVLTCTDDDAREEYLTELASDYLFKDILELERVRNPRKLRDLLTLLAFQIGHEVSVTELSNTLNLNYATVERYLDLCEKAFIIKCVRGFSRNLRKEVTKSARYYFFDNGIRNAVIQNFNALNLRPNEKGMLWENYSVMERIKYNAYRAYRAQYYFWRTYDQQEIDFVEVYRDTLAGYEMKCGERHTKAPLGWRRTYPNATFDVITPQNHAHFVGI